MHSLRQALPRAQRHVRSLATATSTLNSAPVRATPASSAIPLSNVEAQWARMTSDDQLQVHQELEELQKKDWKSLSIDEKKAAYYIAFGPHGPRTPTDQSGSSFKVFLGTVIALALGAATFAAARSAAPAVPKTMSKEWQEASNERALEQKLNPITGIASEGYSGKGFVTSK